MGEHTRKRQREHENRFSTLGELIHAQVRRAIETAVHEELLAALGAAPWERSGARRGYRNGDKERTLTGPTGPLPLTLPRGTMFTSAGEREWTSTLVPRYQRRLREVNEAVLATYLAGGNTRRIRGALAPLLKGAPLSKSAVSRIVATLRGSLEAWQTRSLADLEVVYLYLDALALRIRSAGKAVSVPILGVVAVLADGGKHLLTLDLCGGESFEAWKGVLDRLVACGLKAPLLCIIDGHQGLRRAVGLVWPGAAVQRCCVHKLRNLERKAPKHALAELRDRLPSDRLRGRARGCPGRLDSVRAQVGQALPRRGEEPVGGRRGVAHLLRFPRVQWKTLRTTNVIERLHEEFRRRVKTQGALPTEDAAVLLLFGLVATGQIRLRKIDGHTKLATVIRQRMRAAA